MKTKSEKPVPIVLSQSLVMDIFDQCGKNGSDVLALYVFYYCKARQQCTNQPWVTNTYAAKGLQWSLWKVKAIKAKLVKLNLVENVPIRDSKGQIKWVVKVNLVWKTSTCMDFIPPVTVSTGMNSPRVENHTTSALSVGRGIALIEKEKKRKGNPPLFSNSQERLREQTLAGEPQEIPTYSRDVEFFEPIAEIKVPVVIPSSGVSRVMNREEAVKWYQRHFDFLWKNAMECDEYELTKQYGKPDWGKHIEKFLSKLTAESLSAYFVFIAFATAFKKQSGHIP
jgi:hypothetical protein